MAVQIIRHGCAGDKTRWAGPDLDRPLDEAGRRQADVLAAHFADLPARRIVSSVAVRCVQTVEPLAGRLGLAVEPLDELRADGDVDDLLGVALALELEASRGVICTHGELMRPLLDRFRRDGTVLSAAHLDDDWLLGKGTAWTLTFDAAGKLAAVTHQVPPTLPPCPAHSRHPT
ncbi:MAG TPA: histidine phosphatase family protein [Acidimicrobiales bacterium]|nr:histidine phosphatase family protein [Acidimicrobiales bacterium]